MSRSKSPTNPGLHDGAASGGGTVVACTATVPPPSQIQLVELVEVVAGTASGVVLNPGPASAAAGMTVHTRTATEGQYRQYINLAKPQADGKHRPDLGRYIEVRARLTSADGTATSLVGASIRFTYTVTKGAHRPDMLADVDEKEGFGTAKEVEINVPGVGADGWTGNVQFYLSQYGGDVFTISAQAVDDTGSTCGNKLNLAGYQVWRKVWYQMTHEVGFAPPALTGPTAAFKRVFIDFELDTEVSFAKTAAPAHTFYPEWQLVAGSNSTDEKAIIGGHNSAHFYGLYVAKADKPVRAHLIVCENQWDPSPSPMGPRVWTLHSLESGLLSMKAVPYNAALINPPLAGDLVVVGEWKSMAPNGHADFGKHGTLSSACIVIPKPRTSLISFKIKLPPDTGLTDPAQGIKVKLGLNYARYWGGESNGYQIIITYTDDVAAYSQCVGHEVGHSLYQTPADGSLPGKPKSLGNHPNYYNDDHGGQGTHCSTGARMEVTTDKPLGLYIDGTCIMFHQLSPTTCAQVFCDQCAPFLMLQDATALQAPK